MKTTLLLLISFFTACNLSAQTSSSWTHFRGDDLTGLAEEGNYPLEWSDSTNISWKVEIDGRAWSSPVIYNGQVWITSASVDGSEMWAECYSLSSGRKKYHVELFHPDEVKRKHGVNTYATPTSAIEEGYVYVHFGRYGTACISTIDGRIVWTREDLQCEHIQGPGSSLFLHKDQLIVHVEGTDVQEIYALDKLTGKTNWKATRDQELLMAMAEIGRKAYVTPIIVEVDGRKLLISNGSAACNAYDVETGEEVWFIPQGEDSTIAMPVVYKGIVYFYTGFVTPDEGDQYCELWAVDPRGTGDLTSSIIWRKKSPRLQLLTPVIYDDLLYTVNSIGELQCLEAVSGKEVWTERLKGKYHASPVIADGNVYIHSTRGETIVFKTGEHYEPLSNNLLPGEIWATPAFVEGSIILRTSKGLYRISD